MFWGGGGGKWLESNVEMTTRTRSKKIDKFPQHSAITITIPHFPRRLLDCASSLHPNASLMSPNLNFVTPVLPFRLATSFRNSSFAVPLQPCTPVQYRRPARIVCAATTENAKSRGSGKTKGSGKKKAPIVFAKDLKGNFVWTLRAATADDVDAVNALLKDIYTRDLVATFIESSNSCMVCEASIKGTKEGEGYKSRVMGVALLDVSTFLKDVEKGLEGGTKRTAEIFATAVHPEIPGKEDIRVKLVLGSLKRLKQEGVVLASVDIDEKNQKAIEFFAGCLFKQQGRENGRVFMECNLIEENPEPQKKIV